MRRTGSSSSGLLRRCRQGRWAGAAALGASLLASAPPARSLPGSPPAAPDEPLSAALAAGRVRAEDLRGREVYAFDETRVGTLVAAAGAAAVFALDPRLGLGRDCVAAPLGRVRVAAERRLVLDMTPREFQAALTTRSACAA